MAAPKGRVPILEAELATMARKAVFEFSGTSGADGTLTIPYDAPFASVTSWSACAIQTGGRPTECDVVSVSLTAIKIRSYRIKTFVPVLNLLIDPTEPVPATVSVVVRGTR